MRYYIDPSTLLPAFSVMMSTSQVKPDGSPAENPSPKSYTLFEYAFPDQLDPGAMRATGTPSLSYRTWPFDQTMFP